MRVARTGFAKTVSLAGAATFGALASLITMVVPPYIQPPFPILFYLKFDLAEIADLIAFLIFGPVAGLITALVHFTILTAVGGGPFGPSLKFLAVLSTYAGLLVIPRLGKHSPRRTGISMVTASILTRVALMTIVNYVYIVFIAQTVFGVNYTGFAKFVLSKSGINLSGGELVALILGLTALFNAIHAVFSVAVSLLIVRALFVRASSMLEARAWITDKLRVS